MPRSTRPAPRRTHSLVPSQIPGERCGHGAQSALDALVRDRAGKLDAPQGGAAALASARKGIPG